MTFNIDEAINLMSFFPGSYINARGEVILSEKENVYFSLDGKMEKKDFLCAIFEWCSRDVYKGSPFVYELRNEKWRDDIRKKFNAYIGITFSVDAWADIYQCYGNGIDHDKALEYADGVCNISQWEKMK